MSLQRFKDLIGWEDTPKNTNAGKILDAQVSQNQIALLGTMRAGKTTHVGGLVAAAQYKASESLGTDSRFRILLEEGGTNILHDIGELRAGHFPPATTAGKRLTVKPGFTLEWENPSFFGKRIFTIKRQVKSSILDLAGEDLVQLISQVKNARTFEQASEIHAADQLTNIVNQCTALLVTVNATRAEGLPIYEPEPTNVQGMSSHSDANLARMILSIIQYKHNNQQYSPPLKRIAIIVTACDMLFPIAKTIEQMTSRPFDPLNPVISNDSLNTFVKAFFPSTHATLASLNVDLQYFPSFFEIEKDVKGKPIFWEGTISPKIKRGNIFDTPDWEHNVNRPIFSEYWFNKEIGWLKQLAMVV